MNSIQLPSAWADTPFRSIVLGSILMLGSVLSVWYWIF